MVFISAGGVLLFAKTTPYEYSVFRSAPNRSPSLESHLIRWIASFVFSTRSQDHFNFRSIFSTRICDLKSGSRSNTRGGSFSFVRLIAREPSCREHTNLPL